MIALFAQLALGATWTVPDDGTLEVVVGLADADDLIEVDALTYAPSLGEVGIAKDLTIRGINGTPTLPALHVSAAAVHLEDLVLGGRVFLDELGRSLTVTDGALSAVRVDFARADSTGLRAVRSAVLLDTITLSGRSGPQRGIWVSESWLQLANSQLDGNLGGAIQADLSLVDVVATDFEGNRALAGGDVLLLGGTLWMRGVSSTGSSAVVGANTLAFEGRGGSVAAYNGIVDIAASEFAWSAAVDGGAIALLESQAGTESVALWASLADVTVRTASASATGGGVHSEGRIALHLDAVRFDGTVADAAGGAVASTGGWVRMRGGELRAFHAPQGGAIAGTDAQIALDGVLVDGQASSRGPNATDGGVVHALRGSLDIEGASVTDVESTGSGALWLTGESAVSLRESSATRLVSGSSGAMHSVGGSLELVDASFAEIEALRDAVLDSESQVLAIDGLDLAGARVSRGASALRIATPVALELVRSRVCGAVGGEEGVIHVLGGLSEARIAATVVHGSSSDAGGALTRGGTMTDAGALELSHLTLVDNQGAAVRASGAVSLSSSLLVGNEVAVSGPGITAVRNLYWDNGADTADSASAGEQAVFADPRFVDRSGDCFADLALQSDSPASAPPALGHTGGPDAHPVDRDADGWPVGQDCDDLDPDVHPLAPDLLGDGVDSDCDGDLDLDGSSPPEDCDEGDPATHPGATDLPNDGLDQDCSGHRATSRVGGRGCSHGVGSGLPLGWVLLLGILARRRRP